MISIMPQFAAKTTSRYSPLFLPTRLRHAAALFALASTSPSTPFATSFNVVATTSSFSQHHTSAFGILRQAPSSLVSKKEPTTRLSSTTAQNTNSEETMVSASSSSSNSNLMTPASKLDILRSKMKELNLDVYLVPSDDPHLSGEYYSLFNP